MSIHDSSLVTGKNIFIDTNKECLSIYRENNSYYGSMMNITDEFLCKNDKNFLHDGSILKVANVIQN